MSPGPADASVDAMPSPSRTPGQRLGEPAAAAEADDAVDERVARGVAVEPHRVGQPEVLHEEPPERGLDEALVAVAHGYM